MPPVLKDFGGDRTDHLLVGKGTCVDLFFLYPFVLIENELSQ